MHLPLLAQQSVSLQLVQPLMTLQLPHFAVLLFSKQNHTFFQSNVSFLRHNADYFKVEQEKQKKVIKMSLIQRINQIDKMHAEVDKSWISKTLLIVQFKSRLTDQTFWCIRLPSLTFWTNISTHAIAPVLPCQASFHADSVDKCKVHSVDAASAAFFHCIATALTRHRDADIIGNKLHWTTTLLPALAISQNQPFHTSLAKTFTLFVALFGRRHTNSVGTDKVSYQTLLTELQFGVENFTVIVPHWHTFLSLQFEPPFTSSTFQIQASALKRNADSIYPLFTPLTPLDTDTIEVFILLIATEASQSCFIPLIASLYFWKTFQIQSVFVAGASWNAQTPICKEILIIFTNQAALIFFPSQAPLRHSETNAIPYKLVLSTTDKASVPNRSKSGLTLPTCFVCKVPILAMLSRWYAFSSRRLFISIFALVASSCLRKPSYASLEYRNTGQTSSIFSLQAFLCAHPSIDFIVSRVTASATLPLSAPLHAAIVAYAQSVVRLILIDPRLLIRPIVTRRWRDNQRRFLPIDHLCPHKGSQQQFPFQHLFMNKIMIYFLRLTFDTEFQQNLKLMIFHQNRKQKLRRTQN